MTVTRRNSSDEDVVLVEERSDEDVVFLEERIGGAGRSPKPTAKAINLGDHLGPIASPEEVMSYRTDLPVSLEELRKAESHPMGIDWDLKGYSQLDDRARGNGHEAYNLLKKTMQVTPAPKQFKQLDLDEQMGIWGIPRKSQNSTFDQRFLRPIKISNCARVLCRGRQHLIYVRRCILPAKLGILIISSTLVPATHLEGSQYSWLSSLVYIAHLVFQPVSSFALVRFPIKYWVLLNLFGCESMCPSPAVSFTLSLLLSGFFD